MSGAHGRLTAPILAASFALACAAPLAAQTVSNTFGGLSQSSDEPIDIESDLLVVHDKEKYATFSGSVKAVQGTTTLRAKELLVHYTGGDKLAPGGKKDGGAAKVAEPRPTGGRCASGRRRQGERRRYADHQDRGQGRRHHRERRRPDDHQRLGPLRPALAVGNRRWQCGVNARQECAKG